MFITVETSPVIMKRAIEKARRHHPQPYNGGEKHGGSQCRGVYHHKLAKLKLFGSDHSKMTKEGGTVAGNSGREIENLIRG